MVSEPKSKQKYLYLFIGYPGAGKTTIAKTLAEYSGAKHLWADVERHKLFPNPTHSKKESDELYDMLNYSTGYLLQQNKSVIFDTNFNYYSDREKVRKIADKYNAKTIVIWLTTPKDIAYKRSVESHESRNLYEINMTKDQFDSIVKKLEPPKDDETVIKIDGTKISVAEIKKKLEKYI